MLAFQTSKGTCCAYILTSFHIRRFSKYVLQMRSSIINTDSLVASHNMPVCAHVIDQLSGVHGRASSFPVAVGSKSYAYMHANSHKSALMCFEPSLHEAGTEAQRLAGGKQSFALKSDTCKRDERRYSP